MLDVDDLDRAIDRLADEGDIDREDPLLEIATLVNSVKSVEPRPERRIHLKEQFLTRGEELGLTIRKTANARPVRRRLLSVRRIAAVAMALIFSSGGVVYAAADSMPESPLYPVKRAGEAVALAVTPKDSQDRLRAVFAKKRLREARHLLKKSGKATDHSQAIPLLNEAREAGDRGLKNQVKTLLEQVGKDGKKKSAGTPKKGRRSKERPRPEGGPNKAGKGLGASGQNQN